MHVGIDLGTTFSLIARVDSKGTPVLFPDRHEAERFKTPSVVHIGADGALVGNAVEELLEENPGLTVARFAKLSMGREDPLFVDHLGRAWHCEAISALILKKLARDAAAFTDEPIEGVVISVPAHFSDPQRQATRDAGRMAGLNVIDLVEEPLAAATHYGTHSVSSGQTILVYDLGGGTFDATVLHVGPDGLYALATEGASDLGGKNFDEVIMGLVAEQFRLAHRFDPLQDSLAASQLRRQAEALKIKLSLPGRGEVHTSLLLAGRTQEIHLSRSQFEQSTRALIDRSIEVCERALRASSLDWGAIDHVMMAGGSTLLPVVETALRRASNKPGDRIRRHLPHMAIAYGAALIAAQKTGQSTSTPLLQRITGADLGCRVFDPATRKPIVDTVIARNSPIPARGTRTYYTNRADQKRIIIEVVQVKSTSDEPTSLGYFAFPIDDPRKNRPLAITFGYNEQGMVNVTARDPESGREIQRDFNNDTPVSERIAEQKKLVDRTELCD